MAQSIVTFNGEQQRLTMTLQRWLADNAEDHIWGQSALFAKLKVLKRIIKQGLGYELVVPLKHPVADNPKMSGVGDPYVPRSKASMKGLTRSKWPISELFMTFSIPIREVRLQGGQTRRMRAVETYLELAVDQWGQDLNDMLWAAETDAKSCGAEDQIASIRTLLNKGSTSTTWSLSPLCHPAQVCVTGQNDGGTWTAAAYGAGPAGGLSAVTTVGGIARNSSEAACFCVPVWGAYGSTAQAASAQLINRMITGASIGKTRPDIAFLQRDLYDYAMSVLQALQQIRESKMADLGFESFSWRGVDFLPEDAVPAGTTGAGYGQIMMINSKKLAMVCDEDEPVVEEGSIDVESPLRNFRMLWYGQLVAEALGRHLGSRHANVTIP